MVWGCRLFLLYSEVSLAAVLTSNSAINKRLCNLFLALSSCARCVAVGSAGGMNINSAMLHL
jgi:hypothetical protein